MLLFSVNTSRFVVRIQLRKRCQVRPYPMRSLPPLSLLLMLQVVRLFSWKMKLNGAKGGRLFRHIPQKLYMTQSSKKAHHIMLFLCICVLHLLILSNMSA